MAEETARWCGITAEMCKNMQLATCYDVSVNSTFSRYLTFAPVIFKP